MSYELDHIETLIARDIDNSLSPEEKEVLQAWLNEDETNRQYYAALKSTWALTGKADTDFTPSTEKNWEAFKQQITATPTRSIFHTYRHVLRIAASVILLSGAATAYFVFFRHPEVSVATLAHEKKTVTLPDGSKAYLNQNSKLTYAANFKGKERAVHLEGEAFFEVTQHTAQPFVVYASHTQTQVLGTAFDVKAYDVSQVEVAVVTGKVAFSNRDNQQEKLLLTGGSRGILKDTKALEQTRIEDPNFMAWKENRLSFQDTRLGDVINTLQNYFDVRIMLSDKDMARFRYNGTFDPEQLGNVESVLEVICPTMNLRWTKNQQGEYTLHKQIDL